MNHSGCHHQPLRCGETLGAARWCLCLYRGDEATTDRGGLLPSSGGATKGGWELDLSNYRDNEESAEKIYNSREIAEMEQMLLSEPYPTGRTLPGP